MRVLLTGGTGFVGQHLAAELVGAGHDVVALDCLLPQVQDDPAAAVAAFPGDVVRGDVVDPEAWSRLPGVDAVVHLAAETGTAQSMYESDRHRRVNVGGTRQAGAFAAATDVPLVLLSSRAVYGEGRHRCADHGVVFGASCCPGAVPEASTEDDPHRPVSVYGETKSQAEAALAGLPVPVTIVRPQNVIGPGQSLHNPYTGVLAAFVARLREGLPLQVYGDGGQTRDFAHVRDLAAMLRWAVENPDDRVLNHGTGVRTTLLDLARATIRAAPAADPGIEHVAITRAGDIMHACSSLDRLRDAGGPLPRWSTYDAVTEFVAWAWERPVARAATWDQALGELADHGLAGPG
ncbi:MAG: NAD(P)-dependent oxidoreductase [Nocardioidaceae bacterium]|nr:NAD(P)-dependent oxidoreductase [Nocardioidaceae bacterium]MCL2613015.1 NAD(P)-dependent oxidoreductase [Nocardioidaceae bacterium]